MQDIATGTGTVPKALLNRPTLTQFEQPFYEAFQALSSSRQWTMAGPAAIPLTEIATYLTLYQIEDMDERDEYIKHIQDLDSEFLDHHMKK